MRSIVFAFAVLPAISQAQSTWYVDDDCMEPGFGTKADPFCTIQQGVDSAADGDTVLVLSGTYRGFGNRDISLSGKQILLKSNTGATATIVDAEANPGAIHRGFFLDHGETRETVIEGFTITGGYVIGDTGGSGPGGGGGGAGIYCGNSSPTVRRCVLVANTSKTLDNPFVHDGRGGGLYLDRESSALIDSCILVGNTADRQGGGMLHIGGEDTVASVRNCLLAFNSARQGGGIHNAGGIGIYTNDTIVYNEAAVSGGGVKNEQSEGLIINCIVWGNNSPNGSQAYIQGPLLLIQYSAIEGGLEAVEGPGDIQWDDGNIDADPLFFDSAKSDYHLRHGSPCIDAGNNLAVAPGVVTDLDGDPRFLDNPLIPDTGNPDGINPIVDMGAYEFDLQDCNNNDLPDADDISDGFSGDCSGGNGNGIPDECEPDCNQNQQADSCDIALETSADCTDNGIPDECEPDCNGNEMADSCDLAAGISMDCTGNGTPDECEPDCNNNGQADSCDLVEGFSGDCNENGIPDECPEDPAPKFMLQPEDLTASPGEVALFEVSATGILLEYQWRKDGKPLFDTERIIGANWPTLLILDVKLGDQGEYDCLVTDGLGECALSDPATLTVILPCPADLDGDGMVGAADLPELLSAWGPNPDHPADLNGDGTVGAVDLAQLLGTWGPCL